MAKPQNSICINCKNCLHYMNPEQVDQDQFSVSGYEKGYDLYIESGTFCGVAGITIKMNVLECQMFNERKKKKWFIQLFNSLFKQ